MLRKKFAMSKGFSIELGKTERRSIIAGEMPCGNVELQMRIISGVNPGPSLALTAGVHGSEYCGIVAAHKLAASIKPEDLKGSLAIIPLVTRSAFESRTRWMNPIDGVNPNRAFPGDPNKSISYQTAHAVFSELIRKADAYVDMHGGDLMESLAPHVLFNETGNQEVDNRSEVMAKAFGVDYVWKISKEGRGIGNAFTEAAFSGIPSILSEVGEDGKLDLNFVEIQYNGIVNIMRSLGMLEGKVSISKQPMTSTTGEFLTAKKGGVFYSFVKAGQHVKMNQQIGEIKTLEGESIEEINAPFDSVVLAIVNNPAVKKSDITFELLALS